MKSDVESGRRATVIIVHFGPPEPTVVLANTVSKFGCDLVVIANDLASRPPCLDERVIWRIPARNLGYGDAFSLAARDARTPALVLLNNDLVVSRRSFDRCLDVLLDGESNVGIVGPVLRFTDGELQSGAARLTRWRHAPDVFHEPGDRVATCTWVTGAAMFIRREVADQVGMDGSYFLGCEDADLCIRAGRQGWTVLCCGDAPVIHHRSQVISAPTWNYYSTRNRVWFTRAMFSKRSAWLNILMAAFLTPRVVLADALKRGDFRATRMTLLGLAHALRAKPSRDHGPLDQEPVPHQSHRRLLEKIAGAK